MTQEELKRWLSYDPETGIFRWVKRASNRIHVGDEAIVSMKDCRIRVCLRGERYSVPKMAWLYMIGSFPVGKIGHVNGDSLDNRWSNLYLKSVGKAERRKKYGKEYYENNKPDIFRKRHEYVRSTRPARNKTLREKRRRFIRDVSDWYVLNLLNKGPTRLRMGDVPHEVFEAKRQHIRIKRLLREMR